MPRKRWNPIPVFEELTIGGRIAWLLKERRLSQTKAAAQMGVAQATISNLVNDPSRKPNAATLMKLAKVLNCAPSFIMDGADAWTNYATSTSDQQAELLELFKNSHPSDQRSLMVFARMVGRRDT